MLGTIGLLGCLSDSNIPPTKADMIDAGVIYPQSSPMYVGFDSASGYPSQDTVAQFSTLSLSSANFFGTEQPSTVYSKSRTIIVNSGPNLYAYGSYSFRVSASGNAPTNNSGNGEQKPFRATDDGSDVYWSTDSSATSTSQWYRKNNADPYNAGVLNSLFYAITPYNTNQTAKGEWWEMLMPKRAKLNSIRQVCRTGMSTRGMKDAQVMYSDLGANFYLYGSLSFANSTDDTQTITSSEGGYHRCYRIVANSVNGANTLQVKFFYFNMDIIQN